MAFARPALLWLLLLGALPVVIHLVGRARPELLPFPSIRFLVAAGPGTGRRARLLDIALLALRCALILLFVFLLAGPTLATSPASASREDAPWTGGGDLIVLLDDSPSMAAGSAGAATVATVATAPAAGTPGSRLDVARRLALRLVEDAPPGALVSVATTSGAETPFTFDLGAARAFLESLGDPPSPRRWRAHRGAGAVARAISRLRALGTDRPETPALVFISDGAADLFPPLSAGENAPTGVDPKHRPVARLWCDVGDDGAGDLAVVSVSPVAGRRMSRAGEPAALVVEMLGGAPGSPARVVARTMPEGERVAADATFDATGRARLSIDLRSAPPGFLSGVAEVNAPGADPFPLNNRRFFAVPVVPPARVVVAGAPPPGAAEPGGYLALALDPDRGEEADAIVVALRDVLAADVDAAPETTVFFPGATLARPGAVDWARRAARAGKSVVAFAGPDAAPLLALPEQAAAFGVRAATPVEGSLAWTVGPRLDAPGDATDPRADGPVTGRLHRWYALRPLDAGGAEAVSRAEDGTILLTRLTAGSGSIFLCGTEFRPAGDPWGEPDPGFFLPLAHRLVDAAVEAALPPTAFDAGEIPPPPGGPLPASAFAAGGATGGAGIPASRASASPPPPGPTPAGSDDLLVFASGDPAPRAVPWAMAGEIDWNQVAPEPGVYRVGRRQGQSTTMLTAFAVNVSDHEARAPRLTTREARARGFTRLAGPPPPRDAGQPAAILEWTIAALLVLLLFAEPLVAASVGLRRLLAR